MSRALTAVAPDANADPDAPFGVGDIVRLNSDRVHMTVSVLAGARFVCRWHDQADDLLREEFELRELTLVRKREAV